MTSLKSIDDLLREAAERLDKAANEIRDLPLDPAKEHIRLIGESLVNIFQIQHQIYRLSPDLQPDFLNDEKPDPDPDLNEEEKLLVEKLSADEIQKIDDLLLSHARGNWQKVAMIVGLTMMNHENRKSGIPDIFSLNGSVCSSKRASLSHKGICNTCGIVRSGSHPVLNNFNITTGCWRNRFPRKRVERAIHRHHVGCALRTKTFPFLIFPRPLGGEG